MACWLLRQKKRREEQGAGPRDPLFPTAAGGFATKTAAVETPKAILSAKEGVFTGHTPRRTGAQALVELGV